MGVIDTTSPPAGVFTAWNQIPVAKEPLPMLESEHNNLTPQKEQNWDARSKELMEILVNGGKFELHESKRSAPPRACHNRSQV